MSENIWIKDDDEDFQGEFPLNCGLPSVAWQIFENDDWGGADILIEIESFRKYCESFIKNIWVLSINFLDKNFYNRNKWF